jgi:uncharacterized repeat protein (TIGR03806 family)
MRASPALTIVLAAATFAALSGSCKSGSDSSSDDASPCVAFAKAMAPLLKTEPLGGATRAVPLVHVAAGAGRTYAIDRDGNFGRIDADAASLIPVKGTELAVTKLANGMVRAFVARWTSQADMTTTLELVRYSSADAGVTFDRTSETVVFSVPGGRSMTGEVTSMTFGKDGFLYLAVGDAEPPQGAPPTLLGKILRLDVSGDTASNEVWGAGVHQPRGLDMDPETGELALTDHRAKDDLTLFLRVTRKSTDPLVPSLGTMAMNERAPYPGGHFYRGKLVPALVGKYVYSASGGTLIAVDRFGPSGSPQLTHIALGAEGPLARNEATELVVGAVSGAVLRVADGGPPSPTPTSLLATKCFDLSSPSGIVAGAIGYDVTTPLWSDGATKDRFVVVPRGAKISARPDGDYLFPVGTVAVKSFSVDGKRIETRLLVQHDIEDWVGYSYAWNEAGTDAELVSGNRVVPLAGGKSWYFPSSADCSACHTPAAGYTIGLEAKQLMGKGDALDRLEAELRAPIDHSTIVPLVPVDAPPPATNEARARSYLHANCSMCHREGSVTGILVDLDLRNDVPLAMTGLCGEPTAGNLGLTNPRIIVPRDPSRSVILARMRSLDERRMPKLASRVVDEVGVAAVEAWIKDLAACP